MAKKMYYTEEETAAKLGMGVDELAALVKQGQLQAFPDGARKMYKAEQVDAIAGEGGEDDMELMPAGDDEDTVGLKLADEEKPAGKDDTVITAEGISIFDDEDLEIETADPLAKTQVAPSVEDQVMIEGVGSGSGLLDLTRESDDTSLGPGVLEHIDMDEAVGSDIGREVGPETQVVGSLSEGRGPAVMPSFVEPVDASAGLFTGIMVACAMISLLLVVLTLSALGGVVPSFVDKLRENMLIVIVGGVVLAGVFGAIGLLLGKSVAAKQDALRRLGG